jgi:5-enolpyruvylshikimate-3-phosphate synthase
MSLAIGGLVGRGTLTVAEADCVDTSFPEFGTVLSGLLTPQACGL